MKTFLALAGALPIAVIVGAVIHGQPLNLIVNLCCMTIWILLIEAIYAKK